MAYQHVTVPTGGQKITVNKDFSLNVPDNPIIPYIEGDGTGFDITPASEVMAALCLAEDADDLDQLGFPSGFTVG